MSAHGLREELGRDGVEHDDDDERRKRLRGGAGWREGRRLPPPSNHACLVLIVHKGLLWVVRCGGAGWWM